MLFCYPEDSIRDVVRTMKANQFKPVVVVHESGEVWGLVSRLAIIRFYGEDPGKIRAEDVMRPYRIEVRPPVAHRKSYRTHEEDKIRTSDRC